jgi:ribonuclease HI
MAMMAEMENSNGAHDTNSPPSNSAGTKRKRESKAAQLKFYAVRIGKTPGIYHSWPDCLEQVKGFPKAVFKSFTSLTEAESFLNNAESVTAVGKATKFYGVQSGRVPGVYTSWPDVLEQIRGWKAPKHRGFKTRHEAEQFVAEGQNNPMADIPLDSVEIGDGPAAKKSKTMKGKKTGIKDEGSPAPFIDPADFAPGEGPLPEDAEDGFDSSIILDQTTGEPRYKTAEERARVKPQAVRPAKDSFVKIYTDGSSLGNGQLGAVGGVGVYFGPGDGRNLSEALTGTRQTNQRAELTALQRALELAPRDRKIVIYSDSNYAINCVTIWFQKWRTNNWQNSAGKAVENKDLVIKVVETLEDRYRMNRHRVDDEDDESNGEGHWERGPASVKFVWVKGHAKDEGNNAADQLAVAAAREAKANGTSS